MAHLIRSASFSISTVSTTNAARPDGSLANGFRFTLAAFDIGNNSRREERLFTVVSTEGIRIDPHVIAPTTPVSDRRSYGLTVTAPSGTGLEFCGVIVTYTMP